MTSSTTAPGMSPACRKTQLMSSFGPAMNPSSDIIVWTKTLPITTSAIAIDNRTRTGHQTHRPTSLGRTLAQTDTYSRDSSTDLHKHACGCHAPVLGRPGPRPSRAFRVSRYLSSDPVEAVLSRALELGPAGGDQQHSGRPPSRIPLILTVIRK